MAEKVSAKSAKRTIPEKAETPELGHNSKAVEPPIDEEQLKASIAEQRQAKFIKYFRDLQKADIAIEDVSAVLREKRSIRKEITAKITSLGYAMEDVERAMTDAESNTIDIERRERARAEMREALGVPAGPQADLFGAFSGRSVPEAARDGLLAEAEGFKAALMGLPASVPSQFSGAMQDWLRGWHKGQDRSIKAIELAEQAEVEAIAARKAKEQEAAEAEAEAERKAEAERELTPQEQKKKDAEVLAKLQALSSDDEEEDQYEDDEGDDDELETASGDEEII